MLAGRGQGFPCQLLEPQWLLLRLRRLDAFLGRLFDQQPLVPLQTEIVKKTTLALRLLFLHQKPLGTHYLERQT